MLWAFCISKYYHLFSKSYDFSIEIAEKMWYNCDREEW